VVGIALKDRASILMAGHAADTVVWFDNGAQGWVSSSFYFPNKTLPQWVQKINSEKIPGAAVGKTWAPLLSADHYGLAKKAPFVKPDDPFPFSRPIRNMNDFWTSPYGISFTIETAKRALTEESLGQDDIPDLLAVSLSSNDYVGHAFGPNSPEAMDISLQADRQLSDLFNAIDQKVGLKRTLIVLSADHGVMAIPEEGKASRIPMERMSMSVAVNAVKAGLNRQFGDADWVYGIAEQNFFLNTQTIEAKKADREAVAKAAADLFSAQPGIYVALTRSQIMSGLLPQTNWAKLVTRSYNPQLGPDVVVLEKPGVLFGGGTGTSHGSPWEYDSHIPIVFWGANVNPGLYGRRVYTQDIASTICTILGIEYPTGNMGTPLLELLKK
jgi:predicted AlkP superfamily pyrophosphatase or phosphodiesterase